MLRYLFTNLIFLLLFLNIGHILRSIKSNFLERNYALSLSLSACFLRTRFLLSFAKGKRLFLNAAAYSLCPNNDINGKLLSPNHLWSLPAAPHSDPSACQYKGVIPGFDVRPSASQHVIRGCFRSFSATASLQHREGKLCGSCSRKTYPRLCSRCASNTLIHSGGAGLMILLNVSLIFF